MSRPARALSTLLAALGLVLGGCAGSPDGGGDGDGDNDPYDCGPGTPGGEPFMIELGLRDSDPFIALSDGDELPVVLGFQGFYMSELRLRAEIVAPADADRVCFDCLTELSPGGSFEGIRQPEMARFTEGSDNLYSGFSTMLLGTYDQLEGGDAIDGLEVDLAMTCDGHGFSGSGQRTVRLSLSE
jgi:hypothetical protein